MTSLSRPAVLIFVALFAPAGAWAQERQSGTVPSGTPRNEVRDPRAASLSDAVRRVQRSTGGQILGAERVPFDGRDINRVKYMDDRGRVRYMDDDPSPTRAPPRPPRSAEQQRQTRGDNSEM